MGYSPAVTAWQRKQVAARRCRDCGKPAVAGKTFCRAHREARAVRDFARFQVWKREGRCYQCGGERDNETTRCDACRQRRARYGN